MIKYTYSCKIMPYGLYIQVIYSNLSFNMFWLEPNCIFIRRTNDKTATDTTTSMNERKKDDQKGEKTNDDLKE